MRDAMGGTVTITIIVLFIVIALGYMAFNVNYTKAFRMKDKIITLYDDYKGECDSNCQAEIEKYAEEIGYSTGVGTGGLLVCPTPPDGDTYTQANNIYCYRDNPVVLDEDSPKPFDSKEKHYYTIVTKINLEIPIIKNIMNLRMFYIYGDTKSYYRKN